MGTRLAEGLNGGLDLPTGDFQGGPGDFRGDVGQFLNDAESPIAQFHVGGVEVDHQVFFDLAEANHGEGAEDVQDELSGGAGLKSGRPGEHLRADVDGQDNIRPEASGEF